MTALSVTVSLPCQRMSAPVHESSEGAVKVGVVLNYLAVDFSLFFCFNIYGVLLEAGS